MRAVFWFRNDLRLLDHWVLRRFCEQSREGLIFWTPSPSFLRAGPYRRSFILASLRKLQAALQKRGSDIIIVKHPIALFLPKLIEQLRPDRIYFSSEPTPEEEKEEAFVRSLDVPCVSWDVNSLFSKESLPFGKLPKTYTAFRKLVYKKVPVTASSPEPLMFPKPLPCPCEAWDLRSEQASWRFHPRLQAGERAGLERWENYVWKQNGLQRYKETRNGLLEWDDSSKISAWLAIGALSPAWTYHEALRYERERGANESTEWFLFELLWREYFRLNAGEAKNALFAETTLSPHTGESQREDFARWKAGATGDDFVDAHMKELLRTGWMSNRGRQNVASFLAKRWKLPWTWGAAYFEEQLVDYDAPSNWGNWSYLAGVGRDPRDRTFDPQRQAQMYDADGAYRKKWNHDN